jgi:hypothetical protein
MVLALHLNDSKEEGLPVDETSRAKLTFNIVCYVKRARVESSPDKATIVIERASRT